MVRALTRASDHCTVFLARQRVSDSITIQSRRTPNHKLDPRILLLLAPDVADLTCVPTVAILGCPH